MNCGIVITARVKSSRIPDKALQQINGKTTFEILLDNVSNNRYPVVVAIPNNSEDTILKDIAERKGIEVYRGFDDSPLHRLTNCAKYYDFDHVARVTIDDILIDLTILFNQIKFHINQNHDYTYCSKIPEGCAAEVFKVSVLDEVTEKVGDEPVEFISYYVKNKYDTFEYFPPCEYQKKYRLVMDYEDDLMLLRLIYASIQEPIGTLDIINFLKRHKYFLNINRLPEVTVYTCNYNTEKYIIDTIKSVIAQSYGDYELIIIDDHSTDRSMDVITEFYSKLSPGTQKNIKILRNEENIGLPASCNRALEIARGKYIVRVDSDDTIDKDMIKTMVEEIQINNCQAVLSGYKEVDENHNEINIVKKNMWHPACSLISRWAANELKYQEELEFMEGKDFWNRFKKKYKTHFIKDPLWNYRRRPGQKTQDKNHPHNNG